MIVILCAHFRLVSTLFFKIYFYYLIPAALEVLIYEVTFLHQYDPAIILFWVRTEYSTLTAEKRIFYIEHFNCCHLLTL